MFCSCLLMNKQWYGSSLTNTFIVRSYSVIVFNVNSGIIHEFTLTRGQSCGSWSEWVRAQVKCGSLRSTYSAVWMRHGWMNQNMVYCWLFTHDHVSQSTITHHDDDLHNRKNKRVHFHVRIYYMKCMHICECTRTIREHLYTGCHTLKYMYIHTYIHAPATRPPKRPWLTGLRPMPMNLVGGYMTWKSFVSRGAWFEAWHATKTRSASTPTAAERWR